MVTKSCGYEVSLACEQALRGALAAERGERKESVQLRLWNLNICIKKVNAKCWLADMTLVCLFTFALVSTSCWLAEIWQLSRRGATGELEVEFKFQRRSYKLSFLFLPRHQIAPKSLLAGYCLPRFIATAPHLTDDLKRVQKRALSTISPTLSYANALASLDLECLLVHRQHLSIAFWRYLRGQGSAFPSFTAHHL